MTARFFRREIPWGELTARTGLVPPPGIDPPEAQYNIAPTQIAHTPRATRCRSPPLSGG
jgi:hypothetical protein